MRRNRSRLKAWESCLGAPDSRGLWRLIAADYRKGRGEALEIRPGCCSFLQIRSHRKYFPFKVGSLD